jgi:DNA-binding NtrC family response regulator
MGSLGTQSDDWPLAPFLAWCRASLRVLSQIQVAARTSVPVLIEGETGTGKQVAARAIHDLSRPGRPFVIIDCGAIPAALMESELFGHLRGAFTGAVSDGIGLCRTAAGGSMLLDDIDSLPLDLQPKLLRLVEENEVVPVGGRAPIPIQARVIAASNQDLRGMVRSGAFRRDLYYRLKALAITIPPLRERKRDIPMLARYFAEECAREHRRPAPYISDEAQQVLMEQDWPGNVRELRNCVTHAVLLSDGNEILPQHLILDDSQPMETIEAEVRLTLKQAEAELVRQAVRRAGGNKFRAARLLGIARATLYRKLKDIGEV